MYQKEIEFFWPLTEQIPLDLDYTGCDVKSIYTIPTLNASSYILASTGSNIPTWVSSQIKIDLDDFKFTLNKKPNIIRRLAYKLLGIKWSVN